MYQITLYLNNGKLVFLCRAGVSDKLRKDFSTKTKHDLPVLYTDLLHSETREATAAVIRWGAVQAMTIS